MARLTKDNRDFVVRRVMEFKFGKEDKALKTEAAKVSEAMRSALLGKYKKTVDNLPDDWMEKSDHFNVRSEIHPESSYRHQPNTTFHVPPKALPKIGGGITVKVAKGKRGYVVELQNSWSSPIGVKPRDKDFDVESATAAIEPFAHRVYEQAVLKAEVEQHLRAVVESVTTWNRLYEVWPELVEIVPPAEDNAKRATSLTVEIAKLNELIPLPTKKEAA